MTIVLLSHTSQSGSWGKFPLPLFFFFLFLQLLQWRPSGASAPFAAPAASIRLHLRLIHTDGPAAPNYCSGAAERSFLAPNRGRRVRKQCDSADLVLRRQSVFAFCEIRSVEKNGKVGLFCAFTCLSICGMCACVRSWSVHCFSQPRSCHCETPSARGCSRKRSH